MHFYLLLVFFFCFDLKVLVCCYYVIYYRRGINCSISMHSSGHTLFRWWKLRVLGRPWGLPESLEHWHGTRTRSYGVFLSWISVVSTLYGIFLAYLYCPSIFVSIITVLFSLTWASVYLPTGQVSWSCCCLQEENWIQWYLIFKLCYLTHLYRRGINMMWLQILFIKE